jgi:hypothetical protein
MTSSTMTEMGATTGVASTPIADYGMLADCNSAAL